MKTNPFIFQAPIVSQDDMVYVRDTVTINNVVDSLLLGNFCMLLGPTLGGGTSCLLDILRKATEREPNCYCLYLDLRRLQESLRESDLFPSVTAIGPRLTSELPFMPSLINDHSSFHATLYSQVKDKPIRLILAVDHLDTVTIPSESVKVLTRSMRILFNQRLLDRQYNKISVVICSSENLNELTQDQSTSLMVAESYWLNDLSYDGLARLVKQAQEVSDIEFDKEALEEIYGLTKGDKYFIQKICYLSAQELTDSRELVVTKAMVSRVAEQITTADYRNDRCYARLIKTLKRDPDLAGVILRLFDGKELPIRDSGLNIERAVLSGIIRVDGDSYSFRNSMYERFLLQRESMLRAGWKIHIQMKNLVEMHDATLSLASDFDPKSAINHAAWTMLRTFKANSASIILLDQAENKYYVDAYASIDDPQRIHSPIIKQELVRNILDTNESLVFQNGTDCEMCFIDKDKCNCAWLPITASNNTMGVVLLTFDPLTAVFGDDAVTSARIIATHLASTIIRVRIVQALQTIGSIVIKKASKEEMLPEIANFTCRLLNVPIALIWGFTKDEQELHIVAHSSNVPQAVIDKFRLRAGINPTANYLKQTGPLFLSDVQQAPGYQQQDKSIAQELGWTSLLTMPLRIDNSPRGILEVYTYNKWKITKWQKDLFRLLANQAAVAIEHANLYSAANEARGKLDLALSTMAHQMRDAPGFVTNTIDSLLNRKLGDINERQRDRLEKAKRRLVEYHQQVDRINLYGRLRGEKVTLHLESIQMQQAVRQITRQFHNRAREMNVSLKIKSLKRPIVLQADRGLIEILVINLVDNALKFTPAGGQILVEILENPEFVILAVDDSGVGIPVEHRARIFDEYYQVKSKLIGGPEGAGLGLYIAKRIVEMHGGDITVATKIGTGARLEVHLPKQMSSI